MEHAEIITNAYNFTKNAFFSIAQFPRWLVLFFYIIGPVIVGFILATIVLQLIVLPILVSLLVGLTSDLPRRSFRVFCSSLLC